MIVVTSRLSHEAINHTIKILLIIFSFLGFEIILPHWKESKFLSELSNINRLEKIINSLNVLEATVSLKKDINDYLNKIDPKLFLIEIVPSLIIKEEFEYLDTIFNKYYEEIFTRDRWTADGQGFNFLIGLANVNIFNNNIRAAKINLNLIDLEKVELGYTDYLTLFYNVTWLKIMYLEQNILQQAYYYSEIKRLANKIGFYKYYRHLSSKFQTEFFQFFQTLKILLKILQI